MRTVKQGCIFNTSMMISWMILSSLLTAFYVGIMLLYWYHWWRTPNYPPKTLEHIPFVSILIPVRDESANILLLLEDLQAQHYPADKMEIIVIDDHSSDNTAALVASVRDSRVKLIRLQEWISEEELMQAYKKKAIEVGISQALGSIILTTDGDCHIGENWLWSMLYVKEATGAKLITGPVMLDRSQTVFEHFQSLDFMGMMGITAASLRMGMFNMANGANMLYEKEAFLEVDGFKGIDHKASGDDMLLVYKFAKAFNGAVAFAKTKDAIVCTAPMHSLKGFLQQRFRWTSKSGDYQDMRITWILGLVYLSVLSILINLVAACFEGTTLLWLGSGQWLIKSLVDIPLLNSTSRWFGKPALMKTFFSSQVFHVAYIIGVGTLGNILKYQWKGRTLR